MAQKRMFDKRITDSDKFTDLPNSSKALYFMAGMNADDRGFFQPRRLQKMNGFTDDDFKVLIAKRYFIPFESGVMVITDWNKNNYLDKNRITETEYIDELKMLRLINEKYEFTGACLTSVKPKFNQNSIVENSIVENNINIYTQNFEKFWKAYPKKKDKDKASKWFEKNKPSEEEFDYMMKQLERFKDTTEWKEAGGKYIPYPTSWLNAKRWEDEFETDTEREIREEKEILEDSYYGT